MESHLLSNGYEKVSSSNCLYFKRAHGELCLIGLYVDDCIIAGPPSLIAGAKRTLLDRFDMKDLGELTYVLGLEIKHNKLEHTITISQEAYTEQVLADHGMATCKPYNTPVTSRLSKTMCPRSDAEYRHALKREFPSINYRTASRWPTPMDCQLKTRDCICRFPSSPLCSRSGSRSFPCPQTDIPLPSWHHILWYPPPPKPKPYCHSLRIRRLRLCL